MSVPELPEVETVRAGLEATILGARIAAVDPRREGLRVPFPVDLRQRLVGATITSVGRRAKYALIHSDRDDIMLLHLGMSGRVQVMSPPLVAPAVHDHLLIDFTDGRRFVLTDPRRFGMIALIAMDRLADHPLLAGLGPEPLDPSFDGATLHRSLDGRRTPLKSALLDQRTVAGLGNIYVAEALHRAGLSPLRPALDVTRSEADRLAAAIRSVLSDAIASGGSSLRDHIAVDGSLGYFQHSFRVYGRTGEACPTMGCGGHVERLAQAGRSSFYCPRCQH